MGPVYLGMPPDGFTTVTLRRETKLKLIDIMEHHDIDSPPKAVRYAVNEVLAGDGELTIAELARLIEQKAETAE